MLDTKAIDGYTETPPDAVDLQTYRMATLPWPVILPDDMAAALGSVFARRRLTPFAKVAVDVIASKLEIDRDNLKLVGVTETKAMKTWLSDEDFAAIERELWQTVVRDGRGFLLVNWQVPDEANPDYQDTKPTFKVVPAYDGNRGAGSVWSSGGSAVMSWNAWQSETHFFFDAYYPDRIEKYIKSKSEATKKEWSARQDDPSELWPLPWVATDGSPLGIPLICFSIDGSDIADAIQLAKDLNDVVLDMLAMSRTQGWPQRFIKGSRNSDVMTNGLGQPIISAHTNRPIKKQVVLTPGSVMLLNEGAELGQLPSATPEAVLVEKLMELLSFVTAVPSHYFAGEWPSGFALTQAESRLNHKVEEHQSRLSQSTGSLIALLLRLSNHFGGTSLKTKFKVVVTWMSPQVETEEIRVEREKQAREHAGDLFEKGLMTLRTALKTIHPDWTEDEIEAEAVELEKVKEEADAKAQAALLEATAAKNADPNAPPDKETVPADKAAADIKEEA